MSEETGDIVMNPEAVTAAPDQPSDVVPQINDQVETESSAAPMTETTMGEPVMEDLVLPNVRPQTATVAIGEAALSTDTEETMATEEPVTQPDEAMATQTDEAIASQTEEAARQTEDDIRHAEEEQLEEEEQSSTVDGLSRPNAPAVNLYGTSASGRAFLDSAAATERSLASPKLDLGTRHAKPFIGGFRDPSTGNVYHHAQTQTFSAWDRRAQNAPLKFHRDAQTAETTNKGVQSVRDSATQMTKQGVFITSTKDKILRARPYFDADAWEKQRHDAAVSIQCWYRCQKAKRFTAGLRRAKAAGVAAKEDAAERHVQHVEKKKAHDLSSRLHPRTAADFETLYHGLESRHVFLLYQKAGQRLTKAIDWRLQEMEKINQQTHLSPQHRQAALSSLMEQEAQLLQKIERLKQAAKKLNKNAKIHAQLDAISAKKEWVLKDGRSVHVETASVIRARELKELHAALRMADVTVDERLQVLLHIKQTVKEFDTALTREIVSLIDREADLLSRGRSTLSLEGLRTRLANRFLVFVQTPDFNPEAAALGKLSLSTTYPNPETAVYRCKSCSKYYPSSSFHLTSTQQHLGKCKSCVAEANHATMRQNDHTYSTMLRYIRLQEWERVNREHALQEQADAQRRANAIHRTVSEEIEEYHASKLPPKPKGNKPLIIDMMLETDLRFLVNTIWLNRSAISLRNNVADLTLARWDVHQPLSPWNAIVLTKGEAIAHEAHPDPIHSLYTAEFVRSVQAKQLTARGHFGQLLEMQRHVEARYVEYQAAGKIVKLKEKPIIGHAQVSFQTESPSRKESAAASSVTAEASTAPENTFIPSPEAEEPAYTMQADKAMVASIEASGGDVAMQRPMTAQDAQTWIDVAAHEGTQVDYAPPQVVVAQEEASSTLPDDGAVEQAIANLDAQ